MRYLICGGRNFSDRRLFRDTVNGLEVTPTVIIHGCATGADAMASEWATAKGIPELRYPADWKRYGRSAGPIRNQLMLVDGWPDIVIAFPGGIGTADMITRARADILVREVRIVAGDPPITVP